MSTGSAQTAIAFTTSFGTLGVEATEEGVRRVRLPGEGGFASADGSAGRIRPARSFVPATVHLFLVR